MDIIKFFSSLTVKKVWNYMRINFSYYYSRFFYKIYISGNPYSLTIEPINTCNLECTQCITGSGKLKRLKGEINLGVYYNILDQISSHAIYLMLYFQGEPFLYKNIFEIIRIARQKNIYTATSTNGHFLNPDNCEKIVQSGLNRLIVSVDGVSQESYEIYRRKGKLSIVIEGLENLKNAKKYLKSSSPKLIIQFLVFKHNEHEIPKIKKVAKKYHAELQLKTAQIYDLDKAFDLLPSKNKYSRYYIDEYKKPIIKKSINSCKRLWTNIVFTWNGDLVSCCNDKDANFIFGNAYNSNIISKWKSKRFNVYRRNVMKSRDNYFICTNCNL